MGNVGGSSTSGVLSRIDGLRLILESSPSDDELSKRLQGMGEEIEAMEQAILGNGSYLGIPEEVSVIKISLYPVFILWASRRCCCSIASEPVDANRPLVATEVWNRMND